MSLIAALAVGAPTLADEPPGLRATVKRARRTKRLKQARTRPYTGWVARRVREEAPAPPSGRLEIQNIHGGETLLVNIYGPDGTYDPTALAYVNQLFRCRRSHHEAEIDPRLLEVLSHVYDRFGRRVLLISGHRTNTEGYHLRGAAADIRVPGVPIRRLRRFVEGLDAGGMGVGLYPRERFIHIDVRPPPSYRWVERSAPEKRRRSTRQKPVS